MSTMQSKLNVFMGVTRNTNIYSKKKKSSPQNHCAAEKNENEKGCPNRYSGLDSPFKS
jgi:hypothetical protein